jgi:hypothetical protein
VIEPTARVLIVTPVELALLRRAVLLLERDGPNASTLEGLLQMLSAPPTVHELWQAA